MKYYPENFYKPEALNMEELTKRFNENELVSFTALSWDDEKRVIITEFEDGILGYIPENEICNENLKFADGFTCPVQAHSLLGQTACALITNINGNEVTLSRKSLQQEALKTLVIGNTYNVCIKSITDIGIFADVAVGISAFIHNSEITKTQFNSLIDVKQDYYLYRGKIIPAKLLYCQGNIKMSFRQTLNFPFVAKGDTLYGIVRNRLMNQTGYFVDISPNDTAIVDTDQLLTYGDRILVEIKSSECVYENDSCYNKHHVRLVIR